MVLFVFFGINNSAHSQVLNNPSLNFYGNPGIIDMPSAGSLEDGTIALTYSYFNQTTKTTLGFQVLPRLYGTFRYTGIKNNFDQSANIVGQNYDRSFDLTYRIMDEGERRPSVSIGITDIIGSGIYGSEYIVASKSFKPGLRVTAGLGFGRLGSYGGFSNPFGRGSRGQQITGGGRLQFKKWFTGDAAFFGGLEWSPKQIDGLSLKAEYSSDAYTRETRNFDGALDRKSSLNFGAEYTYKNWGTLGVYYLYGTDLGLRFSTTINPRRPVSIGREEAPIPVFQRQLTAKKQRGLFGQVIHSQDIESKEIITLPIYNLESSPTGIRIATVKSYCDPIVANEIDAQSGVVDLVIFQNGSGTADCTVVLRPAGQVYIEAKSASIAQSNFDDSFEPLKNNAIKAQLQRILTKDKITVVYSKFTTSDAHVSIRNKRFNAAAQAIGRVARALSHAMPNSVENFHITTLEQDIPVNTVIIQRSDLEILENDSEGAWRSLVRAKIVDPENSNPDTLTKGLFPRFTYDLVPDIKASLFDPDNPTRFDFRLKGEARWDILPGLSFNGVASAKIIGNISSSQRLSNSAIQRVRTDINFYQNNNDVTIDRLTADYLFKISPTVYGRASLGIFETMYGGVSAEILWKPVQSNFAIGAELNYVKQRDFDQLLDFRDYETTTGHVSGYWDFGNGFYGQLDVGRYLAKDWGATVSLDRVFKNGWRVGGYATFTDVSFSDFGEGSFDKGIRFTMPFSWLTGVPSRAKVDAVIQPILRDGGARVNVPNRLYPIVSGSDANRLRNSWGRFYR